MPADDLAPVADLIDIAGRNRTTRELLIFAWQCRKVTDPAAFSWPQMLAHVPEGVTGAVNHFLELVGYLHRWEQPHNIADDMKLRYGIVEQLWRLQHTAQPCLSSIAVADTVDQIHPCDGILCTDCRQAVA